MSLCFLSSLFLSNFMIRCSFTESNFASEGEACCCCTVGDGCDLKLQSGRICPHEMLDVDNLNMAY